MFGTPFLSCSKSRRTELASFDWKCSIPYRLFFQNFTYMRIYVYAKGNTHTQTHTHTRIHYIARDVFVLIGLI